MLTNEVLQQLLCNKVVFLQQKGEIVEDEISIMEHIE